MNQEYLEKIQNIHNNFIELIENQYASNIECDTFVNFLKEQNFESNLPDLKLFLHLLVKIANNHHRLTGFFDKIDRILNLLKNSIQKFFTNYQIFDIFKSNKRILLHLFKENIIKPDESIASIITKGKYLRFNYPEYFYEEFKQYYSNETIQKVENKIIQDERLIDLLSRDHDLYEKKREIGENDGFILEIIRKDSINEFISYINQNNCLVTSNINESIFETNSFLLEKEMSFIEYAAFYGSFQIMKFLFHQSIVLAPSLWFLAIHGQNSELIHLLEENSIKPNAELYQISFFEAIKCHHNDLANYIENNFLNEGQIDEIQLISQSINYFNFTYFNPEIEINFDLLYDLCRNGYYSFVDQILKSSNMDLNSIRILIKKNSYNFFIKINRISKYFF